MIYKVMLTLGIIVVTMLAQRLLQVSINRFVDARQIKRVRGQMVGRVSRVTVWLLAVILLITVWGVDPSNLWIFVTGVIGALAVAFFAMWSMLSNIVAGLLLFVSDPFRIDDEIVILPEEIQGVVKDMKVLFVVLEDQDKNVIHVPSNLLFQKVVKKLNTSN